MTRIRALIQDFGASESGATAVEYGLIAGVISFAVVAASTQIGQSLAGFFTTLSTAIAPASP
ncbi:Flp family type IVb pilin [Bosea caraganae]|uniref:Flp family type IVb pilin n=1 Tax=Bosea caraganae TaxID=2763117 RepID=A0A370L4E0_9HYPH|nr:Flp family type IVb pilin [Bosea caraganae]RDJ23654.1 Flp family type IVb pilin [Bosea caraganae]RDJ24470.1 Flp family type IVb pilin [Bosea caraganae]